MKKVCLVLLALVVMLSLFIVPASAQDDPCADSYYYADDLVAWCVLPDWKDWSSSVQTSADLSQLLSNTYSGIGIDDLSTMGSDERVAIQVHDAVDKYIVTAQLFVADYDTSYDSATDLINNSWVQSGDQKYDYKLDNAFGVPIGIVFIGDPGDEYSEAFIMYPFEEIGRTYTIDIFASNKAWKDKDLNAEFNLIANSLYIVETQTPVSTEEFSPQQSGQSNHPVWIGGDILSVKSESGNGSPESAFDNAQWDFNSDGTVTFTPDGIGTDVRSDLFPLTGTYSVNGANVSYNNGGLTIEGGTLSFVLEYSTESASVLITGDLDVSSGVATIDYLVQSSIVDGINNQSALLSYKVSFTQQLLRSS